MIMKVKKVKWLWQQKSLYYRPQQRKEKNGKKSWPNKIMLLWNSKRLFLHQYIGNLTDAHFDFDCYTGVRTSLSRKYYTSKEVTNDINDYESLKKFIVQAP